MCTIGGQFYLKDLSLDARLHYNLADEEGLFLHKHRKFALHKKFIVEGALSPHASLFHTPTEITYRDANVRNKDTWPTMAKSNNADKLQKIEDEITLLEEITCHEKHDKENSTNQTKKQKETKCNKE